MAWAGVSRVGSEGGVCMGRVAKCGQGKVQAVSSSSLNPSLVSGPIKVFIVIVIDILRVPF